MEIFAALGILALTISIMIFFPRTGVGAMALIFIFKFASTYFGLNQSVNLPIIGIILGVLIALLTMLGLFIDLENIKNKNYWQF